jgi:hypothetical protein
MIDADLLFTISNRFVLPAWLLLVLLPRWQWTRKLIFHAWIPMLLGMAYIYAMQNAIPFPEGGGFSSLQALMTSFTAPWLVVAGWIHYLAFDLFVGAWITRDSQRRNIAHLWIVPCLILTLLAGPVGFLLYAIIRYALSKTGTTVETT